MYTTTPELLALGSFIVPDVEESHSGFIFIHLYVQSAFGQTDSTCNNDTISGSSFNSQCPRKQRPGLRFTLRSWKRLLRLVYEKQSNWLLCLPANLTEAWSVETKITPLSCRLLTKRAKQALVPVQSTDKRRLLREGAS